MIAIFNIVFCLKTFTLLRRSKIRATDSHILGLKGIFFQFREKLSLREMQCYVRSDEGGSDASGHAPLRAEIFNYIFYKKTIFCDKLLSLL